MLLSTSGIGGTETFILSIAACLQKQGCSVEIINVFCPNEDMKEHACKASLKFYDFSSHRLPAFFLSLQQVLHQIRKNKHDIVFCFGVRVSMLVRCLSPLLKGITVVIGLRGLDSWRKWYHILPDRLLEPACTLFVPNSGLVAQTRNQREKTSYRKMVTVCNGIDVAHFNRRICAFARREKYSIPADKLVLTTVGNFRTVKGHDFLLDVIDTFRSRLEGVHFVWVGGDGGIRPLVAWQKRLIQNIRAQNLSDYITIIDGVTDVREILALSDVFLLSSKEEGMSRALMEGMAMSLPCVSTNVGGALELLEEGMSGYVVEFGDVQAYGDRILRLISDGALRQAMGVAARKRIETHFDIHRIARQYFRLFELVLSGHRDGLKLQKLLDAIT